MAAGGASAVLNERTPENGLDPVEFFALTCQKYRPPYAKPAICFVVVVRVESSVTSMLNEESVEIWTRYDVASTEVFHDRAAGFTGMLCAPCAGAPGRGAAGAATRVVKLHEEDGYALVSPRAFFPSTLQ
jgi:hypothetical protein